MATIELDKLSKVFPGGERAVDALDLTIEDGELMVFVGPSGCGKTTALRMIAGLEQLTSGHIRIGGRNVENVQARERDVAMIFQSYALYPHLTVRENIEFALKLRKIPKSEISERVASTARMLGLSEMIDRKPRSLSGGQRQRVAMGRAIIRNAQAYLMDEPLSNLDAKLRVQMRAELLSLQRQEGVTTIYVTHDQTEAMTMGHRVSVLRKGVLQQVDIPQELYDHPANQFVAGFIGSPPMNMIDIELRRSGDGLTACLANARLAVDRRLLERRPGLARYVDRRVALGIRPEDIEDAAFASGVPEDQRLRVKCTLREALGSEILVHFSLPGKLTSTEDIKELAADLGDPGAVGISEVGEVPFVARVSPRSTVAEGDEVELAFDSERLHFFDLESGTAIYD
jgi:multiple sugar transport system ATP-binding protein